MTRTQEQCKPMASEKTVQEFIATIYPQNTELALAVGTEETILRDAINLIASLRTAVDFALSTIEHHEGLKHRKDLFTNDERNKLRAALNPERS